MPILTRFAAVLTVSAGLLVAGPTPSVPAHDRRTSLPDTVPLAPGSQPEGIAGGPGGTFFAGARADGAIYKGDLRTGRRVLLVPGQPGRVAVGMRYDERTGRLWVAGGATGSVTAYDGRTGREIVRHVVPGTRFLNDVDVSGHSVHVTDSRSPELVVVPRRGTGGVTLLPLTGDWVQPTGNGANGIRALPGGDLVVVSAGTLYRVGNDGVADRIELTGPPLTAGDGLVLHGRTLYVVFGFGRNSVAVVDLVEREVVAELFDTDLDRPTTATLFKGNLFVVNGRFSVPPTPSTPYDVVRVRLP